MDYAPAIWVPSPNFNAGDYQKSFINDHWTVGAWDPALRTLTTQRFDAQGRNISVSAHYLVGRDGTVAQMVREKDRAWHNGMPGWNEQAIGIEHEHYDENPDEPNIQQDWPAVQLAASAALHADISRRWGFPLDRNQVLGHRETGYSTACPGDLPIDEIIALALGGEDMTPDQEKMLREVHAALVKPDGGSWVQEALVKVSDLAQNIPFVWLRRMAWGLDPATKTAIPAAKIAITATGTAVLTPPTPPADLK